MLLPDTATLQTIDTGPRPCRGLWVGQLFVRAAFDDECSIEVGTGRKIDCRGLWLVDLMPSMATITRLRTFDVALLVADELSRHAPDIHDCRSPSDIEQAVSPPLVRWILYAQRRDMLGEAPLAYRQWRAS